MGKTCGKTKTQCSEDLPSSDEKCLTPEEFYVEFRKQLSGSDLKELSAVFHMMNISSEDISKCLYKFMGTKCFKKKFKEELSMLQHMLNEVNKKASKTQEHLLKHCFAVLYMYLEIIEKVYNAKELNDVLTRIAMGHGFLMNIKYNFKMHDYLLQKFMKDEFEDYMDKSTLNALRRYMSLISVRIISLAENYKKDLNFDSIVKTLTYQKGVINAKLNKREGLSEVYTNPSQSSTSELSLFKNMQGVFPGTSSASSKRLDKKSKQKKVSKKTQINI
ncbi:hypothetical protein ILUMI_10508 [Ignelater luminosus]|uniref:Uncharacterized protein n=1 Tax=Ignelater luminosus TaxID=2038154 RepID=A0A8K0GDJ5_IGNLU|nr:hypothetical protein ILUMI_10508 [Ignelater luminosus]